MILPCWKNDLSHITNVSEENRVIVTEEARGDRLIVEPEYNSEVCMRVVLQKYTKPKS